MSGNYNRKDHLYKKAKDDGHRSRAAYKLLEIDQKHKILRYGSKILDLGAWPGGWLQIAASKVGPRGLVVGIDLKEIEDFGEPNVRVLQGDVRDKESLEAMLELAGGKYDTVISDMSPKLTGIKEVDSAQTVGCAELALWVAQQTLKHGGSFAVKLFKAAGADEFVKSTRPYFNKVVRLELKSTRKTSNEFYVVGLGFKGS